MKSNEYLKNFDFKDYLNSCKKLILDKSLIKDYIEEKGDENLRFFSEMFWDDAQYGVKKLKEELDIPNNIGYIDILQLFPNDKYIELLNDIYLNKLSNEKISNKYKLVKSKINEFMFNPIKIMEEQYCPSCLENEYEIDFSEEDVIYKCLNCRQKYREEKLLSETQKEEVQLEHQLKYQKKMDEFEIKIKSIRENMEQIKCPKCQNNLRLFCNDINFTYEIKCTTCNYSSRDYLETLKAYKLWERRAAMMIAIRAKEEEIILKTLKTKEVEKTKFISEKIISTMDMLSIAEQGIDINIWNENDMLNFERLKQLLKHCNRLEKNLLIELIKVGQARGKSIRIKQNLFIQIMFENPLVSEIIETTSIIPVRKVLKMLMKKYLVLTTEEDNYILIPSYIADKLDVIENFNKNQNVEPNLRYITMSRQNFTCLACGESGRRLKIAYLTANKNTMNLDELVALCEDCFELETQNEVIIDGAISFEIQESEMPKSVQFLVEYIPDFKNSSKVYDAIINLEEKYGCENTIKALAVTINKIESKTMDTTDGFIAYTRAILNNADLKNVGVSIYRNIYTKYKLDSWGIDESCVI